MENQENQVIEVIEGEPIQMNERLLRSFNKAEFTAMGIFNKAIQELRKIAGKMELEVSKHNTDITQRDQKNKKDAMTVAALQTGITKIEDKAKRLEDVFMS